MEIIILLPREEFIEFCYNDFQNDVKRRVMNVGGEEHA